MRRLYLLMIPLLFANCTSNKPQENVETLVETDSEDLVEATNDVEEELEQKEFEEENFIMIPGETYSVSQNMEADKYGNKTDLTVELIAYKDKTFSGQVIQTVTLAHRDEPSEHKFPIEGEWDETSMHDKRVMKVEFELAQSGQEFTIYIDEEHNAYINDLNSKPVKLTKK